MEICNFCRFIEDIEILLLHNCLLSSPPRFRQLLSKSLYSFGCYSNVKGKFLQSHYFGCYGNLKFPLTYKTKSEKLQFFENYCSLRPEKW